MHRRNLTSNSGLKCVLVFCDFAVGNTRFVPNYYAPSDLTLCFRFCNKQVYRPPTPTPALTPQHVKLLWAGSPTTNAQCSS